MAAALIYGNQDHSPGVTSHAAGTAPRLSHVGLYVHDVPKMIDFYTKVLGFVVSDGAEDGRITFLSRNPSDHHQVVLVRGRDDRQHETPMVQQVSFNVETLANVQRAFRKVREAGCEGIRPVCHGNAWSVYFQRPGGQPDRDVLRHPVVRAAAAAASRSTSTSPRTNSTAKPKPSAAPAGLQADRGMARRDQQEDRRASLAARTRP